MGIMWKCFYFLMLVATVSCLNDYEIIKFLEDFTVHEGKKAEIFSFLRISDDAHAMAAKKFNSLGIMYASRETLLQPTISEHTILVSSVGEESFHGILRQAEKYKFLNSPARWIIFVDEYPTPGAIGSDYKSYVENRTENVYFSVFSEVYVAVANGTSLQVYSVYRRAEKLPLDWEFSFNWSLDTGIMGRNMTQALWARRKNLGGISMTALSVISDEKTKEHLEDFVDRHVDTMVKYSHYMAKHLFEYMNVSGKHNFSWNWGYRQPDGTFNGGLQEFHDGRAHISGSPFMMLPERLPVIDFVVVPSPLKAVFVFKQPALSSVTNIFSLSFSRGVWVSVVGLIMIIWLAVFIISYNELPNDVAKGYLVTQRLVDSLTEAMYMSFQQGIRHDPYSLSGRLVFFLGLLALFFLVTAHSASIVALLQSTSDSIRTLNNLLESPLTLGFQDVQYSRYFLKNDQRWVGQQLYKKKIAPQGDKSFLSVTDGIRLMRQGMYAFHVERTSGYDEVQRTFREDEKCHLQEIFFMPITYPYLVMKRGLPYKELIKIGSYRLKERGVQDRTTRRILTLLPRCDGGVSSFSPVEIRDLAPVFFTYLFINLVAMLIFVLELAMSKFETLRPGTTQ